jgi:hypothetical protein
MKTITISGKIKFGEWADYSTIILEDKDNFRRNLVSRLAEIADSFPKNKIQVSYWLSDDFCTKEEMLMKMYESIYGDQIKANFEDNGFMGSEWTGYCPAYDTTLEIGGHDLYRELSRKEDMFMIIDFNILD